MTITGFSFEADAARSLGLLLGRNLAKLEISARQALRDSLIALCPKLDLFEFEDGRGITDFGQGPLLSRRNTA